MHPAQLQALHMLLNQLHAAATQQVATIQHVRQMLANNAAAQFQQQRQPPPHMQAQYPDVLSQQEEAMLSQGIAQSAQLAAEADGNDISPYVNQLENRLGQLSPHFAKPQQRVQQQRRAAGQVGNGYAGPGQQTPDQFAGMFDAMGFGG